MVVTKALTMVAAHVKQLIQHLVNLDRKNRTVARGPDANGMNTGTQHNIQKIAECNTILQQIRPTALNRQTKIIEDKLEIS